MSTSLWNTIHGLNIDIFFWFITPLTFFFNKPSDRINRLSLDVEKQSILHKRKTRNTERLEKKLINLTVSSPKTMNFCHPPPLSFLLLKLLTYKNTCIHESQSSFCTFLDTIVNGCCSLSGLI